MRSGATPSGRSDAGGDGPLVGVLALQGNVAEHCAMLARAGARPLAVRRPRELDAVEGIVLPGGESTTMAKLARAFGLMDPLARRLRDGMPAFGTCAGMILLADRVQDASADQETFGGLDVVVRRNAFGRQVDSFEADLSVDLGPDQARAPYPAVFIRAPWVEKVGSGVGVVATVAAGSTMGRIVAVRQDHLLATSFHPELTDDHRFHTAFVDLVRRAGTPRSR
ncbi:MAG TPA: pyridoxal 5'-phosphate synthase glutaminase subunit PdxT [Nocardioidaceae bacterium]|nr:pyridoxal 5'-phosphate synthase glutaminase subunit PdxT [Nocardioidaceae bacterium]